MLLRVPKFTTPFLPRLSDADGFSKSVACWGRGRRRGWLRECPPACGLRLDLAKPQVQAKPQVHATPPTASPSATSVCGVRCSHTHAACRIRLMGRLVQRHQEGSRRPGDSRGAERPVGLILPAGQGGLACHHFENIRTRRIVSSHYNCANRRHVEFSSYPDCRGGKASLRQSWAEVLLSNPFFARRLIAINSNAGPKSDSSTLTATFLDRC